MVHSQLALFREKSEIAARSIEKDAELQQSTKKVKEYHRGGAHHSFSPAFGEGSSMSYKKKLVGEILGAFEQAFAFDNNMDVEVESDDEFTNLLSGEEAVKLFGARNGKMRAP